MLELTSPLTIALVAVTAITLPIVALVVVRPGVAQRGRARTIGLWAVVTAAQLVAVVAVLLVVNDEFGLYAGWDDLLGRTSGAGDVLALDPTTSGPVHGSVAAAGALAWKDGLPQGFTAYDGPHSYLAMVRVPGSVAPLRLYVDLPAQYFEPQYAATRFPVVELLHGYPGTPTTWFHAMDVRARRDQATSAGATPFVLVVPQISVAGAPDLECTDLPGQPQVATFLTSEVRSIVDARFRVRQDRAGWGLMGYSEGGYCAAQLLLRHPTEYAAAVSIAGYDAPESSAFSADERAAGDLRGLLRPAPAVSLLVTASSQDPQSSTDIRALTDAVRPPTTVTTRLSARGGHNTGVWSAQLPADFAWLTTHLAALA